MRARLMDYTRRMKKQTIQTEEEKAAKIYCLANDDHSDDGRRIQREIICKLTECISSSYMRNVCISRISQISLKTQEEIKSGVGSRLNDGAMMVTFRACFTYEEF